MKAIKQIVRKYYKYIYTSWTRPNLTSNGTLGGDSFAISVNSEISGSGAGYNAFDANTTGTHWVVGTNNLNGVVIMYNPTPIKITQITITNGTPANRSWSGGTVYGSDDNITYTQITTFSNSAYGAYATWNISLSENTQYYKYYKLNLTSASTSAYKSRSCDILPLATQRTVQESTAQDYDFYEDVDEYKVPVISGTYYGVSKQ